MKPEKLEQFMYGLMKEARRSSFIEFIDNWNISYEEWQEIEEWFNKQDIKL